MTGVDAGAVRLAADERWARVMEELEQGASRHRREQGALVTAFISETEARFAVEVEGFIAIFSRDPSLDGTMRAVRDYLVWMRWVGWNVANLGPIAFEDTRIGADRLAIILLAYIPGRLVDDGLDDHADFKGYRSTLVGALRHLAPGAAHHVACVLSAQLGFSVFHHAVRRMRECGMDGAAEEAGRLFDTSVAGLLAESFVPPKVSDAVYYHIVRRKQVAYNMILYRLFLADLSPEIRVPLLRGLAVMDEIAQLLNDCHDVAEDRAMGRLNALTHGILHPERAPGAILERIAEFWEVTAPLPAPYRDALAAMCQNLAFPPWLSRPS